MEDSFNLKYILVASLVGISVILSIILAINFWRIPFPVNCWFCNNNDWVQYISRNSWFCQKCQQYNGFSKNGDYNKPIVQSSKTKLSYFFNRNRRSPQPAHNGLCHKCNTNQQLKVMQLASFKPMNEKNFDREIDAFTSHLEEVYKLCHDCKKYVNRKLLKEKGNFLIKKKNPIKLKTKQTKISTIVGAIKKIIGNFIKILAILLLIIVLSDICLNADLFLSKLMLRNVKQHFKDIKNMITNTTLVNENIKSSTKYYYEAFITLPGIVHITDYCFSKYNYSKTIIFDLAFANISISKSLQVLTSVGIGLQLMLYLSEFGMSLRYLINVAIWATSYYISRKDDKYLHVFQLLLASVLMFNSKILSKETAENKKKSTVFKNMKNLSNSSICTSFEDKEDLISDDDSDLDIPQNRTSTPDYMNQSQPNYFLENKHNEKLNWANTSFCSLQYNKPLNGFQSYSSPPSKAFSMMTGPNLWQKSTNASGLDESISTLTLGNKFDWPYTKPHVFSTKQYKTVSPTLLMCSPTVTIRRPILSPSRFTQSTQQSWVAGGYWGTDSPKKLYNVHDTSRSSSQSSGFESLASSSFKPVNSYPASQEESVAGEYLRKSDSIFSDNRYMYNNNNNNKNSVGFERFYSPNSTMNQSVINSRPSINLNTPYCASGIQNLNLNNEFSFSTSNPNYSFRPVKKPS